MRLARAAGALLLLLAGGCFQIETLVKMHEDGSATITERYQLSRRLLEFEKSEGGSLLSSELAKEAVLERMKLMGKGITLVSHEMRDGEAGSRESVSTFKIAELGEFQYASPFMAIPGYPGRCLMKCRLEPVLQSSSYLRTGMVGVRFDPVVFAGGSPKPVGAKPDDKAAATNATPADLQIFRHLQPVIRDMLQGVRIKFTVECYAPVAVPMYTPLRNQMSGTYRFDLIDFSDKDLDAYSSNFLDNEEIMLEMVQMKFGGPNIMGHLSGYGNNLTLPLFHANPPGLYHVPPSRYYFDKFFAGKSIGYYNDPKTQKPAVFDEIGFKGPPTDKKAPAPDAK
jgi:hypothetical protein